GVGDVVGDEHPHLGEVDEVGDRRQDHRHVEPLVDAGVELDVHRERVLDAERVADPARDEQAAAGDAEDDVRPVAVGGDRLRELARATPEVVPRHHFALTGAHAVSLSSARVRTSIASETSSSLESSSGWCETPPLSERTNSIDAFGTNIASWPAPKTRRR